MISWRRGISLALTAFILFSVLGCRCPNPSSRAAIPGSRFGEPDIIDGDNVSLSLMGRGFVVGNIHAKAPSSQGSLAVDIRKPGGGSLRAGRVSVSQEAGVLHNLLTLPFEAGDELRSFVADVPAGGVAPETSVSIFYLK